jgi:acetyltransferase-like isoleucine patch superfamily enzyme
MSGSIIGALEKIELGKNVLCGANTTITDFDWHSLSDDHRGQNILSNPVVIHDNVWLGMNTVVLKGVEIGENSVIGANSVVTKSIPANAIAAGNPAKIISRL